MLLIVFAIVVLLCLSAVNAPRSEYEVRTAGAANQEWRVNVRDLHAEVRQLRPPQHIGWYELRRSDEGAWEKRRLTSEPRSNPNAILFTSWFPSTEQPADIDEPWTTVDDPPRSAIESKYQRYRT